MKVLLNLFVSFAKIGLFTLGGGYAMLPLMERELVDKQHLFERKDFLDMVAVAQAAPGVMAVNLSIIVGYKTKGFWGAFFAASGAAIPSFVIILLIAVFFRKFAENTYVQRVFMGLRPAVVALIAVPVFNLAKAAGVNWKTVWICAACALAVWLIKISPVYIVFAVGLGGFLFARKQEVK
jgi:chromate transporter